MGGAGGTPAALTGARKEAEVLEEEQEPQFLPHLPANIRKNTEQCPERERLEECNHHLLFPGRTKRTAAAAQVTDTWQAQAGETTAGRGSLTSAPWNSTTQN